MHALRLLALASVVLVTVVTTGCPQDACATDDECADGDICTQLAGDDVRSCAPGCAADIRCPAGTACLARSDGSLEGVCLAVTGAGQVNDPCTDDLECGTGACVGDDGAKLCVDVCDAETACSDVGDRCTLAGLRRVCVPPSDNREAGEICNVANECLSGTCVLPPGGEQAICADNCVEDDDCVDGADEDFICVRLVGGARTCLVGSPDGTPCDSSATCAGNFCIEDVDGDSKCASACLEGRACADGFACELADVDDGQADVCMPTLEQRASGDVCERARECESGHCAHFIAGDQDFGTLCADPCDDAGQCGDGLLCWEDPEGTDVCGPSP